METVEKPLNHFLIEHRDGPVLFDTGIDPAIAGDGDYISSVVGRLLLRRIFRLHVGAEDRLDRVLAASGVDAGEIRTAVTRGSRASTTSRATAR